MPPHANGGHVSGLSHALVAGVRAAKLSQRWVRQRGIIMVYLLGWLGVEPALHYVEDLSDYFD